MHLCVYSRDRSLGQIEKPHGREEEYMKLRSNEPASYHCFLLKPMDFFSTVDYYE